MIPGSNILNQAHKLITPAVVQWSKWTGNTTNAAGIVVSVYAQPVAIRGDVQPVPRSMYETLGLDLSKNYITIYTETRLRDLERNNSCDLVDFAGRRYNVQSNTPWNSQDGWGGSVCIDVGGAPQ